MSQSLSKMYEPKSVEETWYRHWEEKGYFAASVSKERKPFCITIPPPNVTGELHMGHAIQHSIHDLIIRWKRMQGFETLCLPGTDHAGIATQMKVEEELQQTEGKTRYDVGREALLEKIWAWKERYGQAIYDQLRKLGASYDWSRQRFTLDDGYVEAVLEAFERFAEQGWIYRGTRMINWCPNCRSVISDLETEDEPTQGHLWHIKYEGIDGGPDVVVATTRPETMLGDTAVAVHPGDERWASAVGSLVMLPLMERPIPIVADEYADPEMGSGAVKVTPSHDPNDYEIGSRHDLQQIQVIGFDGMMTEQAGSFAGMERYECRKSVVDSLKQAGLLVKVDNYEHVLPRHDKCGSVIEPLPMEQWFMNMKPLAQKTLPYLTNREIRYVPDRFQSPAIEWLENIRDWALSRQIWWGHRIPAWYCISCSGKGLIPLGDLDRAEALEQGSFRVSVEDGANPIVSRERPDSCPNCGGKSLVQDPDVLDTWFSSGLWPFATLGWPKETPELAYFHPTSLMITARDILYLWVLRMAMTSAEFVKEIPFETVLVHPTILTKDGRRMSKSLGTGLNPLDLVDLYGADATRFCLLHQAGSLQDVRFDAKIENNQVKSSVSAEMGRNFCNKIWNAARFTQMNLDGYSPDEETSVDEPGALWILGRLSRAAAAVDRALAEYRFNDMTRTLYDFLWHDFCDWYVELAKVRLTDKAKSNLKARSQTQQALVRVLDTSLRLLHPVMPFVTEAVWQTLPLGPGRPECIMVAPWPRSDEFVGNEKIESQFDLLQRVVTATRTIRGDMNIPPATKIDVVVSSDQRDTLGQLEPRLNDIRALAKAGNVEMGYNMAQPPSSASAILGEVQVYIPLEGIIDIEAEQERLNKEIAKFHDLLKGLASKLEDPGFLSKAPAQVVERERARQDYYRANLTKLEASLELLSS